MDNKKTIAETGYGWITPSGKIVACPCYRHMNAGVLAQLDSVPNFSDIDEHVQEMHDGCQELSDDGEHPEWHTYEMALDDGEHTKMCRMMEAGFIRVGVRGPDKKVHLEGMAKSRGVQAQRIVALLRKMDRGLSDFKWKNWDY